MPVTVKEVGQGEFEVTVTETASTPTTEIVVDGVPVVGTIRRVQAQSSADPVAPILGRVTDPETAAVTDLVVEAITLAAAAALTDPTRVDRCGATIYRAIELDTVGRGRLFHRARTTGDCVTVYRITTGW